jgi:vesicular inhibitory amino acid transporter
MAPSSRNPTTWDEYEGRASPDSLSSSVLANEQAVVDDGDDDPHGHLLGGRRRYRPRSAPWPISLTLLAACYLTPLILALP